MNLYLSDGPVNWGTVPCNPNYCLSKENPYPGDYCYTGDMLLGDVKVWVYASDGRGWVKDDIRTQAHIEANSTIRKSA